MNQTQLNNLSSFLTQAAIDWCSIHKVPGSQGGASLYGEVQEAVKRWEMKLKEQQEDEARLIGRLKRKYADGQ